MSIPGGLLMQCLKVMIRTDQTLAYFNILQWNKTLACVDPNPVSWSKIQDK